MTAEPLIEKRRRALAMHRQGEPAAFIAAQCGLSIWAVYRLIDRGDAEPKKHTGRPPSVALSSVRPLLETPVTLKKLRAAVAAATGVRLSLSHLHELRKNAFGANSRKSRPTLSHWTETLQREPPAWDLERWIEAEKKGDASYPDADDRYILFVRQSVPDLTQLRDFAFWFELPDKYQRHLPARPPIKWNHPQPDDFDELAPLAFPTHHRPHSAGRLTVYQERAAARLAIHHPEDSGIGSHENLSRPQGERFRGERRRMSDHLQGREIQTADGAILRASIPQEHFEDLTLTLGGRPAAVLNSEADPAQCVVLLTWEAFQKLAGQQAAA